MSQIFQSMLDSLTNQGVLVSFAYGPCGDKGVMWSVDVLTSDGQSFKEPFGADCVEQAIAIAVFECHLRGWIKSISEYTAIVGEEISRTMP